MQASWVGAVLLFKVERLVSILQGGWGAKATVRIGGQIFVPAGPWGAIFRHARERRGDDGPKNFLIQGLTPLGGVA
jgi:hypothetical protein